MASSCHSFIVCLCKPCIKRLMTKGVRLRQEPGWGAGHHGCNVALHAPRPLQAVNPGRSLFLLYALKSSPRLGLLYLYLFDYTDTFLPFIHTICPLQEDSSGEDIITKLLVGLQGALNRSISPFLVVVFNYHYSDGSLSLKSKKYPAFI